MSAAREVSYRIAESAARAKGEEEIALDMKRKADQKKALAEQKIQEDRKFRRTTHW